MPSLSLIAHLGLNKTGFEAGLNSAGRSFADFSQSLKGQLAGAFSAAAIAGYVKHISDAVGRIKDLADQYGITTDEVQRTDFALKQNGLQFEDLSSSLVALGRHRREAARGNEELVQTFMKFGASLTDLQNPAMRTFDVLQKIADAQKGGTLTAKEQLEIMDLLGPRAGKLVNILGELSDKKIEVISKDAIVLIDDATKSVERLIQKIEQISATKLAQLIQLAMFLPGLGGKERLAAAFADALAGGLRPLGAAAAAGIDNLGGVKPKQKAPFENLWDEVKKTGGKTAIQSDQFQRIGAFTGAAGQTSQAARMQAALSAIEQIKVALTTRGIIVRGTD